MINADTARALASVPQQLKKVENLIKEAAEQGEPGVWVPFNSYELHKVLQDKGYEITIGIPGAENNEDNRCRKDQTWVWWGYSNR